MIGQDLENFVLKSLRCKVLIFCILLTCINLIFLIYSFKFLTAVAAFLNLLMYASDRLEAFNFPN